MSDVKPVSLKDGAIVILRTLMNGPVKFGKLRIAYFGIGRAKTNTATTAFYMKTKELIGKGLVSKADVGYELTELGRVSINAVPEATRLAAKSEAEKRFDESAEGQAWHLANPVVKAPAKTEDESVTA
jgi:hypothetical protein